LNGTQIEIKGKMVYLKRLRDNNIYVGIQFTGTEEENISFVKEIVKNYHYKNANTKIKVHDESN
jgi:DNA repair protein RadC